MNADDTQKHLDALGEANRAWGRLYPGDAPARQPIHTVYGGAHLYKAETTQRLGEIALRHLATYAPDAVALARGVGFVPQGREIFPRLSVEENLRMGLATGRLSEIPDDI